MMLHLAPFETLSPKRLVMMVREDVRTMQDMITRIQRDLRTFQDVKNLKAWLKSYRIPEPEFDPFFDGFPPFR